ncbi:vomeronasal 1 receptor oryCunV1R1580 [Oryctolagus cuniculus]|uniref:vomeronasal 1 receptor oryCunV1R1580 n=1 Tax=Oryctolagus cuniculus TaxID=9986 RepID=UPI0001CE1786|nr:vomeronasal 1 receptor oryCunV1R1580 [Oryctolagus cuniculus]
MFSSDMIDGLLLIFQTCIGVAGNLVLLQAYVYTFLIQPHLKKPIDVIFMHLTAVNILTILFTLIPDIMSSLRARHFLGDVGCKVILYIFRVARGLSICTTSLLSAFQAITISPSGSKCAWLKSKLSACIFPSFLFFWAINMLIYIYIIETVGTRSNITIGHKYAHPHCQTRQFGDHHLGSFLSAIMLRDVFFVVLMIWTSLYMVNHLCRHHRRARHIHSSSLSCQTPPENKAIHTILLLVSCFVFFYCSNNLFTFYSLYTPKKNPRFKMLRGILSTCYPTICPFVLMKNNKIISRFTSSLSVMRTIFSQRASTG